MRKKLAQIYVQFFDNFTKLYGLSHHGSKSARQFNSALERKVKTRALKGIFLVCKWINNTLKSNSVRYHMLHRKNLSFLSSFDPHFLLLFYHHLDSLHQCTKFHLQSMLRSFTKESP